MAKLYFKYGAMGSSKSAQALITQFNYEERGMTVWLIKPSIDDRDGANIVKSRVGLFREADVITPEDDLLSRYQVAGHKDVIIADIPVLCFGLRTDFLTHLFPGSQRLMELADSITEIKTICSCGAKATVNARLDPQGNVLTQGSQVFLGGNDSYVAMCHRCWRKKIQSQQTS